MLRGSLRGLPGGAGGGGAGRGVRRAGGAGRGRAVRGVVGAGDRSGARHWRGPGSPGVFGPGMVRPNGPSRRPGLSGRCFGPTTSRRTSPRTCGRRRYRPGGWRCRWARWGSRSSTSRTSPRWRLSLLTEDGHSGQDLRRLRAGLADVRRGGRGDRPGGPSRSSTSSCRLTEYAEELLAEGYPEEVVEVLEAMFGIMRAGHLSAPTKGVEQVLGRPPASFAAYAERTFGSLVAGRPGNCAEYRRVGLRAWPVR